MVSNNSLIDQSVKRGRAGLLAFLSGVSIAVGVVAVWYVINERAHEHIDVAAGDTARFNQVLIEQDIKFRLAALERLSQRWSTSAGTPRSVWEADAARYIADMPGFQSIQWVDSSFSVRWSVSTDGGVAAGESSVPNSATASWLSGKPGLSEPFEIGTGGLGITAYFPVARNGEFDGFMAGVINVKSWLTATIGTVQSNDYYTQVYLGDSEVYRFDPDTNIDSAAHFDRSSFEVGGLTWTMLIAPTSSFLSAGHAESSSLVLIVGLILSPILAAAVYLAVIARQRSRQLHDVAVELDTLFQSLPGIAYRRDTGPGAALEFVSDGCRKLTGYTRKEFESGQVSWSNLIHSEDKDDVLDRIGQAIDEEKPYELEYRLKTKNSEERWVWERGEIVVNDEREGPLLEGFISDITDKKKAEAELLRSRAFSEAVVDTAADAIITIDARGAIQNINRAAQQMFGYDLDEVLGRNVKILMPATYRADHDFSLANYTSDGISPRTSIGQEVVAQRKDGSRFPIYLSVSEVDGHPERMFVGLIRDISIQRRAESEARQHRETLAHVDRLNMLGEMATGIAHEINQPLTAISLFALAGGRLLESGDDKKLAEVFEKLTQHAHRASAVIERMQSMARRRDSAKEVVDCNSIIDDVAKLAEAEARIRDMTIEIEKGESLPPVSVDVVQIQQVALNLLRNGMEAMEAVDCRDGNSIRLTTRLLSSDEIEVAVIDRGGGVADDVAENIFAPFSTTKKSGMGMGLSISRSIITAHGGRLDFINCPTTGAKFFFTLPTAGQENENG